MAPHAGPGGHSPLGADRLTLSPEPPTLGARWRAMFAQPPAPLAWLARLGRPPAPPPVPGADGAPTGPRGRFWGTKPLGTSRRHKERLTRDFGTALDSPLRGDLEEMPVDHGQEGLKLAARLIRGPPIHQLRTDPQQMRIQDLAPDGAGIRPPVLRGVQRGGPADVDPGLIPDSRDDQPWPPSA